MEFQTRGRPTLAPRHRHAESMVLPRLVVIFPHVLTSLHRVTGGPLAVCAEVPLRHTRYRDSRENRGTFPPRIQKLGVSVSQGCSRFGTVFTCGYRQAVSRLSWLSFSPPRFSRGRRESHSRSSSSPKTSSPRRPALNEDKAPEPRGGISELALTSPALMATTWA